MLKKSFTAVLSLLFVAALSLPAAAAEENPYLQPDDTWISISGTVESVSPDEFVLDYGEGVVTVEMDDGDRDADAYALLEGDKVTVSGMIDDDFYEMTTIEASSVYVEKLGTYFYASAVDEEDYTPVLTVAPTVVVSRTVVQGTVSSVSDEEFTLNTGDRMMTVEVEEMGFNPLDDEGLLKIEEGDRVSVSGNIDDDLFEGKELVAHSIVKLHDAGNDNE